MELATIDSILYDTEQNNAQKAKDGIQLLGVETNYFMVCYHQNFEICVLESILNHFY